MTTFSSKDFAFPRYKFKKEESGKGRRPFGSGAKTRQELGNLVLVRLCEFVRIGGEDVLDFFG